MSLVLQHTLAAAATLEGTSLHTGEKVTLTLKPAAEGHGFKFRRIDLPDQPFINADVDKVQTVERATTLGRPGARVGLVLPSSMAELAGYAPVREVFDRAARCDDATTLRL